MTGMLASVTSVAEASTVLNNAVDIIDLKQPSQGALGALTTDIVAAVVNVINDVVPTSATIGDVDPNDPGLLETICQMSETGVDIVKVGLFETRPTDYFIDAISKTVEKNINLVIVLFAENYIGNDSYKPLLQTGIKGIMLDTKDKSSKNLREILCNNELEDFIKTTRSAGLLTGLAGSLRFSDIENLLKLKPDYLGFRGALCSDNNRVNRIDSFKIKKIRNAIPQDSNINYDLRKSEQEVLKNGTVA